MDHTDNKVDYLKKVQISFELENQNTAVTKANDNWSFEFIYGAGASGITPFEKKIYAKSIEDEMSFSMRPEERREFFGHLIKIMPSSIIEVSVPFKLKAKVLSISLPKDQEVVRAMANDLSGGCGCDCGCGC